MSDLTLSNDENEFSNEKLEDKMETLTPRGFTKLAETLFLGGVALSSVIFGFGTALAMAKKKDPEYFLKGLVPENVRMESGTSLALRAFGRGSLYAIGGCGVLFYAVWKLIGVKDLDEFRQKAGAVLPRIPKNEPPQGRTDFKTLTEMFQYIVDEDEKAKQRKLEAKSKINNVNNVSDNN